MTKPKVAIFSDLHLGIYGNSELWHKVALDWSDWIVGDLKSRGIKDVFFLGDFFHNRSEISVQTLHVASEILKKFSDFEMVFIVGNHDAFYKNRPDVHSMGIVNGYEKFTLVDKNTIIESFGKKLLFVPWNGELDDGTFDYVFGHFEIETFKMNNYKVCDHGHNVMDFLKSRTSNVFSGHFHHRNTKTYNEGMINYVGNTFPMDFSDLGNVKGYHILDIEGGGLEFIENNVSPRFIKVQSSDIDNIKRWNIKGNVVRLMVDNTLSDKDVEKIQMKIHKANPWQFTTEYVITSSTITDIQNIESVDLLKSFTEYIMELKFEDELRKKIDTKIKDLYNSNN